MSSFFLTFFCLLLFLSLGSFLKGVGVCLMCHIIAIKAVNESYMIHYGPIQGLCKRMLALRIDLRESCYVCGILRYDSFKSLDLVVV